jgi:CDP-diacylglycerol--glycerol-3-phosphate 3-phosphatidyltransferase
MKLTIPNQLTILRIILTPVFVWLFIHDTPDLKLYAAIVFLIASITDWYDGYIARRFKMISRLGQFLDPLADKILVSSALLVFAYLDYIYWWMVIIIVTRDTLITFLRSFALTIGRPIITSNLAKWKTFTQMTFIFIILLYVNIPILPDLQLSNYPHPWQQWTTIFFFIITLITAISGILYLISNWTHLQELWQRIIKKLWIG